MKWWNDKEIDGYSGGNPHDPLFEISRTAGGFYSLRWHRGCGGDHIAYFSRLKDAKFIAEKIEELGR